MTSRTQNTIRNSVFNILNQLIAVVLQFILRTVFIKCLAIEYLGISGLFTNILSMLALTELGIGTAIVCSMYKPLADGNREEINKYFNIYKKIYTIIGSIILLIGLVLVPFLHFLIKDAANIPNLELLYFFYLIDTVSSYFFAHYRSLLSADQKEYINANNRTLFLVVQTIAQSVLLFATHNYIIFLLTKIVCNILSSYTLSIKVKKNYPYLKRIENLSLDRESVQLLKNDTVGVFSTRIAMTVLNSTDSLIMSAFLGSVVTAYYSNYSLLIGTISTAMGLIFSSVQASIGNYCVTQSVDEQRILLFNLNYMYYCIYGFCTICLWGLVSPFIQIWLGDSFVLPYFVVIPIILKFYLSNVRQTVLNFLSVNHMLNKIAIKNIIEVLLNLVVSIFLVNKIGIAGIFVGTCIGMVCTSLWYEPLILFKECFEKNAMVYYIKNVLYLCVTGLGCFCVSLVMKRIFCATLMSFIVGASVTCIIAIVCVTLPFIMTREFGFLLTQVKRVLNHQI